MYLSIITNGDNISGVFFDAIDLYFNLCDNNVDCELYIMLQKRNIFNFCNFIRKSYTFNFLQSLLKKIYYVDNKLYDFYTKIKKSNNIYILPSYIIDKDIDLGIFDYYEHVISHINLRTFLYLDLNINKLDAILNMSNFVYLITPFVYERLANYKCKKYIIYSKLSKYRLDNMISNDNNNIYINTEYDSIKEDPKFNIHDFSALDYRRRNFYDDNLYIEIKGKAIFEFLYFNKPVYYHSTPKTLDDGLTDYLRLFNVDDNVEQMLKINNKDIYNKLVNFNSEELFSCV